MIHTKIKSKATQKGNLMGLLELNTEKMNFQQNMCFQMRNWAIVITLGILTVIWGLEQSILWINLVLHGIIVVFLLHLSRQENNWYYYFVVFRERAKYLEEMIIKNQPAQYFYKVYYTYHTEDGYPDKRKIKQVFKKIRDVWYYRFLLLLVFISLILDIINHAVIQLV